jgi:peptidyl-dipeptidase Dcp
MPQELRNKMLQAQSFNQAYALGENIASCLLDLSWHTLAVGTKVEDFQAFEKEQLSKYGMYNLQIPPRYKVPYFRHIWSNGYASGYYSYLWAEALDNDVFAWFQKNGGMTPENGAVLRKAILSAGNSVDLMEAFASITGHTKADINPLLQARGLK